MFSARVFSFPNFNGEVCTEMQKIILKTAPSIINVSAVIYLAALSIITYVCYLVMPPLFVLQALLGWALIYNFALSLFGTPLAIDDIYILKSKKERRLYPWPGGLDTKYSFLALTEAFVVFASARIYTAQIEDRGEIFGFNNLFTLLISVYFCRKMILLLRGIDRYGQQVLSNSLSRHYVQHERYSSPKFEVLGFLITIALYSGYSFREWQRGIDINEIMFLPYISLVLIMCFVSPMPVASSGVTTIILMSVTVLTVLQFHFIGISYSLLLFFLFLAILFTYLILMLAKDVFLRYSHILFSEFSCDELKQDIKECVRSFAKRVRYAVYLALSLYFILVVFLFTMIFRLKFVRPIAPIFGLDYFFSIVN